MCFKESSHKQVCLGTLISTQGPYGQSKAIYYGQGSSNYMHCRGNFNRVVWTSQSTRRIRPRPKLPVWSPLSWIRNSKLTRIVITIRGKRMTMVMATRIETKDHFVSTARGDMMGIAWRILKRDCPKNKDQKASIPAKLNAANAGDAARNNLIQGMIAIYDTNFTRI